MRYGRVVDEGAISVFSVGSEEEAEKLLVLTCSRNYNWEFVAQELVEEQTIENLEKFSTRLDEAHDKFIEAGLCGCYSRKMN